jgi:hypothetical protein
MRGYIIGPIRWQKDGEWGTQVASFPRNNPSCPPGRHDKKPDIKRGFVKVWRMHPSGEARAVTTKLTTRAALKFIKERRESITLNEEEKALRAAYNQLLFDEAEMETMLKEALHDIRRDRMNYSAEIARREKIRADWFRIIDPKAK